MTEPPPAVKCYIDARMADHHREHAADVRALEAATRATDARLEGMNEFRAAMGDQVGHFVTREVFAAELKGMRQTAVGAGIASGLLGIVAGALLVTLLS